MHAKRIKLPRQRSTYRLAGQRNAVEVPSHANVILVPVIVIQIFDTAHEIARKGVFDAAADRPSDILAAPDAVVGQGFALMKVEIGDGKSARNIKEQVVERVTAAAAQMSRPIQIVSVGD